MRNDHRIRVSIDRSACVGSGPCFVIAPRAFELDESAKARVLEPEDETRDMLLAAAEECPTQAIYLSEDGRPLYP
ncbi:MAG TPA: ferredoxin [Chloroflexota bacterium]|nr:ferredoxin [Chloroflexota bacterium]